MKGFVHGDKRGKSCGKIKLKGQYWVWGWVEKKGYWTWDESLRIDLEWSVWICRVWKWYKMRVRKKSEEKQWE